MHIKFVFGFIAILLIGCATYTDDYEEVDFEVSGNFAIMSGVIDSDIKEKLEKLLNQHPQITTIIMQEVEGSVDDDANLEAARMVRKRGLNTLVPSDGVIASGGTDFFLAGVKRTVQSGAMIGVHSWAGDDVENAIDLPKDHPEHKRYLEYYKEMNIPSEFYWYTLKSAPSDDIHWMTPFEQQKYMIATE